MAPSQAPKVILNYTTFRRDHDWLKVSLDSFKKYGKGFAGVTIVVPMWDLDKFLHFEQEYSTPDCPVLIKNFLEYPGKGFVHHLAMKCYADVFSPNADLILHMDPDCLFSAPVSPDDYIVNGKPVLLIEPYEVLKTVHPARYYWKQVTEAALGFECKYETMCRHPAIHWKHTYVTLRNHMESVHLTPFYDFVIKQQNSYPQFFGEFNTLGAYVHKMTPSLYHFIDRGENGDKNDPPPRLKQLWSYTGIHAEDNQKKISEILG